MTKYQDLKNAVKRSWMRKNTGIVPVIIIGATGTIKKNLSKNHKPSPKYYHKQITLGGCAGLGDDPEKNPYLLKPEYGDNNQITLPAN